MFGQRASVCVVWSISTILCVCLVTLTRLNNTSNLNSTNILCQAISPLANNLGVKWAERPFVTRAHAEAALRNLET